MEIRLIGTEKDYEEALAEIARLWNAETGSRDAEKLELLAMLAHTYERSREPLPPLDPVEAIKFRMDQQGLSRKDLLSVFGTTARVSEVLGGKRSLTLDMIRKLHALFGIALESLIAPRARAVAKKPKKASHKRRREKSRQSADA